MKRNDYFMVSNVCSVLIAIMLMYCGSAYAETDTERFNALYNKVKLLGWLVNDSPVSKRIENSEDAEAKQQLKRSQDMWQQAREHSEKSEFELAEVHISEGLKLMTRLSRKVKDQDREKQARIKLYKQVKEHVDMFVSAFDRIAVEKGEDNVRGMLDRNELETVMSRAETAFDDGELAMANHLMRQAADMVDTALSDARHEDVLLHELNFESLEEEYEYEVSRNESYVVLIDLMQKKTARSQSSASYVKTLIEANTKLRQQADEHASYGQLEQGIAILEKGTDKLSRALRVSGAQF
jgi:hypothetical protein